MSAADVGAFAGRLVGAQVYKPLADFVLEFAARFYPELDDSFTRDVAPFLGRDEPCVPHTLLVKCGMLSVKNASTHTSAILQKLGCEDGKHFRRLQNIRAASERGRPALTYLLHPDVFILSLVRAKNTRKHAMWFVMLQRCLVAYGSYQAQVEKSVLRDAEPQLRLEDAKTAQELAQIRSESTPSVCAALSADAPQSAGSVYFIECGSMYKIGFTGNLPERLAALQIGNPFELTIRASFLSSAPAAAEAAAHKYFEAYHVRGEWYAITRADIDLYIGTLHAEERPSTPALPSPEQHSFSDGEIGELLAELLAGL